MKFLTFTLSLLLAASLQADPAITLETKGECPVWINGTFVHNGLAKVSLSKQFAEELPSDPALLHAFQIKDGKVIYNKKLLQTKESNPNANINVAKFFDQYVALSERPLPVIFDIATLESKGLFDYQDTLPKKGIWESALPHCDPATEEVLNYFVEYGKESLYYIYRMTKGSTKREPIAQLAVDEPSYMHSFAITPHYIILSEFPFILQNYKEPKLSSYRWIEGRPLRILIVNRQTGKLIGQYKTEESVFAFHHINSYEKDHELVIDMAAYPDASCITNPQGDDPDNKRVARFTRYRVSLLTHKVVKEQLGPAIEMPCINYERSNGKPYEYVYGIDNSEPLDKAKRRDLVKIDTRTKKLTIWTENGCFASEPVFIAKPGAKNEDDGIILSIVLDTKQKRSFLLFVEADTFKEIGRAFIPHEIPLGLHGEFFRQ